MLLWTPKKEEGESGWCFFGLLRKKRKNLVGASLYISSSWKKTVSQLILHGYRTFLHPSQLCPLYLEKKKI